MVLGFVLALVLAISLCAAYPECGIKGPSSRIVGGRTAAPGEFPWQVSLQPWKGIHSCGGTIWDEEWIITAAHCFPDISNSPDISPFNQWTVRVGMWNITSTTEKTQDIKIDQIFNHPGFNPESPESGNDIALIKLKGKISFNDPFAGPACLPNVNKEYRRQEGCITSGWGNLGYKFDFQGLEIIPIEASTLQKASGKIWTREAAQAAWVPDRLSDALLGFGRLPNMTDCHGDSGGPLVCKEENGAYSLVGVVSFGDPDCGTVDGLTRPTMFTEVAAFNDWLHKTRSAHSN